MSTNSESGVGSSIRENSVNILKKKKKRAARSSSSSDSSSDDSMPVTKASKSATTASVKSSAEAQKQRRAATETAMAKIRDMQRDDFAESESDTSQAGGKKSRTGAAASKVSSTSGVPSKKTSAAPGASLLSGQVGQAGGHFKRRESGGTAAGNLRKRSSRIGDPEWEAAVFGEQRVAAVIKAIDRYAPVSMIAYFCVICVFRVKGLRDVSC
jgi:hypothetical protein